LDVGQHLEPDSTEQTALAKIRRLRSQGTILRGIAAALNHRAFRTRRGTAWRLESVARVVKQNGLFPSAKTAQHPLGASKRVSSDGANQAILYFV